jgi:hypothetical protein
MTKVITVKKKSRKKVRLSGVQISATEDLRLLDVLGALGDEITLDMFSSKYITRSPTRSRKQHYSRMQLLKNLGLFTKVRSSSVSGRIHLVKGQSANPVYVRTALGNVVFQIVTLLEKVLTQSWRWKGLDAFNGMRNMTPQDRENIRTNLMSNPEVQEIVRILDSTSHLIHEEEKKGGETGK